MLVIAHRNNKFLSLFPSSACAQTCPRWPTAFYRALDIPSLFEQYDSPHQRRRRLADLLLGPELAARVYGPLLEQA